MKLAIFGVLLSFSLNVFALESDPLKSRDHVFQCKLKVFPKIKKLNLDFRPYFLADEQDVLKLPRFYSVAINGNDYYFSGALTKDNECSSLHSRCRMVVYLRVNAGEPTVGYANKAQKVGAMNSQAKLSCVLSKADSVDPSTILQDEL